MMYVYASVYASVQNMYACKCMHVYGMDSMDAVVAPSFEIEMAFCCHPVSPSAQILILLSLSCHGEHG